MVLRCFVRGECCIYLGQRKDPMPPSSNSLVIRSNFSPELFGRIERKEDNLGISCNSRKSKWKQTKWKQLKKMRVHIKDAINVSLTATTRKANLMHWHLSVNSDESFFIHIFVTWDHGSHNESRD